MSKILIIEDEKNLARFVELELQHEKYDTTDVYKRQTVESNGRKGLDLALRDNYDAILLDLMLPDLNGLEIARRVRQEKTTPIIMMTARDSVIDRVSGLDHGADDYIVKPFAIEELLARLRAVLRRVQIEKRASGEAAGVQRVIRFNDLTIETANRIVHRGDKTVDLTKREYNLLMTLIEHKNNVVTREQLLKKIWGSDSKIETNVVEVYVRYLRNKIDVPGRSSYIKTVRGTGYMVRTDELDEFDTSL
ncbi:MAG: response regulator transcription factor [Lactobacillus iners]|nr:response regulator transcription factor [Lactobacillus iners]